ncbi:MAG: sulfite exporter TauE/SafE family protein [Bacteroidota bacterium]
MEITLVLLVILLAFMVRATFGFGDALVGMPLLALTVGIRTAAPLMALLALVIALLIFLRYRQWVDFSISWKLIVAALAGVPVGLLYLTRFDEALINLILGVIVVVFALSRWRGWKPQGKVTGAITWITGFFSGILGAAYNTNGPPVIMLLSAGDLEPKVFRATLQSYFFFTGLGVVAGHIAWGNVDRGVFEYFLAGLPVVLLSYFLGDRIFVRLKAGRFYGWVYAVLLVLGCSLIAKSLM